jgi:hypothetical protein
MSKLRKMLKDAFSATPLQAHGAQVAAWSQAVLALMLRRLTRMLQRVRLLVSWEQLTLTFTTLREGRALQEHQALEVYRGLMSAWAAVSQAQAS